MICQTLLIRLYLVGRLLLTLVYSISITLSPKPISSHHSNGAPLTLNGLYSAEAIRRHRRHTGSFTNGVDTLPIVEFANRRGMVGSLESLSAGQEDYEGTKRDTNWTCASSSRLYSKCNP